LDANNLATSSVEKIAAQNIRQLLVKSVSPVLKSLREPPDNPEEFRAAAGCRAGRQGPGPPQHSWPRRLLQYTHRRWEA
jgi:hypothetical protein